MKSRNSRAPQRPTAGFTLIELMIVIAVLALLMSLAVPAYNEYVLRANRSEGVEALLAASACQERVYTKKNRYDMNLCDINTNTSNGHYRIQHKGAVAADGQSYTLRARARNAQLKDSCGNLELNQRGERNISKSNNKTKIAKCWKGRSI